jgi:ATP-dependent DNA helicase RecG
MTLDEVSALASRGESEGCEHKKSTGQRTEAGKTACAMLNGVGGTILFGVAPDGKVEGQELGQTTVGDLLHEFRRIEPQIPISPDILRLPDGKAVIVVSVPGATGSMYTFDGRPYLRQGATTLVMGQDEYRRRLLEQMHPSYRWELLPASGLEIEDLDASQIMLTVEESVRRGRLNEPDSRGVAQLLRGFGLVRDGVPLNAAVVLFGRSERLLPAYAQCMLRMARFRGTSTADLSDNRQAHGNIFELAQLAACASTSEFASAGVRRG